MEPYSDTVLAKYLNLDPDPDALNTDPKKWCRGRLHWFRMCVTRVKSCDVGGGSTNSYRLPNAASGVQFGHGYNFLYVVLLVLPKIDIDRGMARTEYRK